MTPSDAQLFTSLYDALADARPAPSGAARSWSLLQACNMSSHVERAASCTSLRFMAHAIAEILWTAMSTTGIEPQRSLDIARAAAREWAHMRLNPERLLEGLDVAVPV